MELTHRAAGVLKQLIFLLIISIAYPPMVHAQSVPGCEFPPVDEPDGDGDECYTPPDPSQSTGNPNNPDTNAPSQPGQQGGEPISYPTGNMFLFQRDYASSTVFPLSFDRVYNSQATSTGPLGAKWTDNYAAVIKLVSATTAQAIRGDGKTITFTLIGGLWTAGPAINSRLSQLVDSSGNTTGWVYRTGDDKTETYDANGRLRSLANRAGVTQTLSYTGGLLTNIADPFGRSLTLTYDAAGRIVALTDPSGRTYEYTYDAQNNLASILYPDGTTRQYLYENSATPNLMTALIDEKGVRYVTWTYDTSGHALSSTFPGGIGRINASYDFINGSTYVTDALGNTTRYDYFTFGGAERTLHVNRPASKGGLAQNSYLFDANGNISSYIDFDGNTTNYTFDPPRNLELSRTLADGRVITTTWNPTFRLPSQIQSGSRLDRRSYDNVGNLISQTLTDVGTGLQRTTSFSYNAYGEVLTSTDPNGNRTTFAYDGQGNLVSIRNALGQKTTFVHDADGRVIRATDPNGLLTTYQYDARQRLIQKTVGDQRPYRYVYDATGQLISLKQPSEYNLTLSYDQAHRLIAVTDPFGNQIQYTLDATGNRLSEVHLDATQSVVYTHSRTFDALGRLATTIGASGQTHTYTYNDDGDRLTAADPLGGVSSFTYDSVNRLVASMAPDGGTTSYSYDLLDHLVAVTDPRQLVTQFETNALGATLSVNSPDAGGITQQADANGNVISRTDSRGQTLRYEYDALNRLTRIVRADTHQVVYGFNYDEREPGPHRNGIGRLTSQYDALSRTDYSYDQAGRLIAKTQTVGGNALRTRSFFDPRSGNLRLVKLPSGAIIHFRWSKGRIDEMSVIACRDDRDWDDHVGDVSDDFWEGCQFTKIVNGIQWEPFGGPSSWLYGNGEQELRTFDLDGRITGESIDSKITYDPASRIAAVTLGGAPNILASGTRSYSYDANGRLTEVSSADNAIKLSYLYDLNGNRLQVTNGAQQTTYTFDPKSNHLLGASLGPTNYAYDSAGNTVQEGTASYTYDVRNRLSSATTTAGTESYYYNGRGQRIEKTGAWGTVVFFYDNQGRLIGEYDKNGRPIQETIYFGNIPVAVLTRQGLFYIHTDYRNAPRQIDDARGMPVWTWDPTSFGVDLPNGRPLAQTGPVFVYNLRFPGQYFDAETGLNYNGNRDYNPRVGRYAEADPIGLKGGLNVYTYVGDNPVSLVDPLGLEGGQPQSTDLWSFLASHPGLVAAIIVTEIVGLGPEDPLADAAVAAEIEAAEAADAAATAEAEAAQGAIDAQEIAAEEEAIVAEEEGATAQEEAAGQDAINQNKLDHIFGNPEHDLDGLVDQYGSQSDAYRAIQEATQTVVDEQGTTGVFETTVNVGGETITVRGTVIDGIVRIGTAFK